MRSTPVVGQPQQQRHGQQQMTTKQSATAWQHLTGRQHTSEKQPMLCGVVFAWAHERRGAMRSALLVGGLGRSEAAPAGGGLDALRLLGCLLIM